MFRIIEELSVSIILKKKIALWWIVGWSCHWGRTSSDHRSLASAVPWEINVTRNVNIKISVDVVIAYGGATGEAVEISQSGILALVNERSVTLILI